MKNTKRGKITWANFFHGLIISIGSAVLSGLTTALTSGTIDVKTVGVSAAAAGLTYLGKKVAETENGLLIDETEK